MKKFLVSVAAAAALLGGATACDSGYSDSGYDTVVQYGYYDSFHHYHYYASPHQVRVTHVYYLHHTYEYQPHGTQRRVSLTKTTTTTRRTTSTTRTTVSRSSGFSRKRR